MSETIDLPSYWDELLYAQKRFKNFGYLSGGTPQERMAYLQEEMDSLTKLIKEQAKTDTPALFYPKLTAYFVERIMPNLPMTRLLQDFFIRVGATACIPKAKDSRASAVIGNSAYGDKIIKDFTPYENIVITPYKMGMRVRVTQEVLEDQIVTIVEDQFRSAAGRVIATIEGDVAALFDAATKRKYDWLLGRRYPRLDTMLKNRMDEAARYVIVMNDEQSTPYKYSGYRLIHTSQVPLDTAYVVQTAFDGCYCPIGYLVTKRPISLDIWPQPTFDALDVFITTRYAPVLTYPEAITRCRV